MGKVNILCKFTAMNEDLRAKKATIHHSEVLQKLLKNSKAEIEGSATVNIGSELKEDEQAAKKARISNTNKWHPKLRSTLEKPLKVVNHPTFTRIMNLSKADSFSVFPKG